MPNQAPLVTNDVFKGVLERVIYGGAMFITAKMVAAGHLTPDMAAYIAGGAVGLFGGVYAWWVNRPVAIAQSAAALPNTKVITTPDIAAATQEANIVSNETAAR